MSDLETLIHHPRVQALIELALNEDAGAHGDLTSSCLVPEEAVLAGGLVAREAGVLAGMPLAEHLFARVSVAVDRRAEDGEAFDAGRLLAEVRGPARAVLRLERVVLNFLQRLSGVASLTRTYAQALGGGRAHLYDTRKTTPGWRLLEKYAVRMGGGRNHRMDLSGLGMIKDNHLQLTARRRPELKPAELFSHLEKTWRERAPAGVAIEVEVESFEDFAHAAAAGFDLIMLDNMDDAEIARCVAWLDENGPERRPELEVSGGITLARLPALAGIGVDRISVGALTHSARALDVGLDLVEVSDA